MIICGGNQIRNREATKFAAKYAYERSKIKFPVFIDLNET